MHLSKIEIMNFRCFGDGPDGFEMSLRPCLTALVGENDAGKTAVIDALRFVLGTTDQEWFRLEDSDFHRGSREIRIVCKFENLSPADKRAFVEYLTYGEGTDDEPVLYVNWTATDTGETYKGRAYRRVEIHAGKKGDGPTIATEVRDLLRATYLRPLRDAEQALTAGRGSRLSQVLQHMPVINDGEPYVPGGVIDSKKLEKLNVLGIGDLANDLLKKHKGIEDTREQIDSHLKKLSIGGEGIASSIDVSGVSDPDAIRLRRLLEKLNLSLSANGKLGLGSNNLLFMACEFLLLAKEEEAGSRVLLIEEPESHVDAQRQLRAMAFLQEQAKTNRIQVIVTTHSPNLASVIDLDNIVMIRKKRAFSMAQGQTQLESSDYRFLRRFLDVTKANLFFARGVMIVEGDAENILLPTLAKLLGRDFTEHGVSIVNVGGVGLRRYARIFQRTNVSDKDEDKQMAIPVACLTDMDVMPECAPTILGKIKDGEGWPETTRRRWKAKSDFTDPAQLREHRKQLTTKADGQCVKTFVSDEWTLEYDLALGPKDENGQFTGGLAEDVYIATCLAEKDEAINAGRENVNDVTDSAVKQFTGLGKKAVATDGCTVQEVLAVHVYAKFARDGVSKAVAAQYLAERLHDRAQKRDLSEANLRKKLPRYLVEAIEYVTGTQAVTIESQPAEGRP